MFIGLKHYLFGWLFFIILFFYFIGYRALGSVIFDRIPGGHAVSDSSDLNIYSGDYLIGSSRRTSREDITRGSYVLTELVSIGDMRIPGTDYPRGYAQIIAMPGEKISIEKGFFVVDDKTLDSERYPVPAWLKKKEISQVLQQDQYFISANYRGNMYNEEQILTICIITPSRIEAKAFLRWMPLSRRGLIEDSQ